jgi:hypothetical protein
VSVKGKFSPLVAPAKIQENASDIPEAFFIVSKTILDNSKRLL